MSLLEVRDLSVVFTVEAGRIEAVKDISFAIDRGETLALVGESGSGKSVTALSVVQLLPYPIASHPSGSILVDGHEMMGAPERELRRVRGNRVSMIFQEPMTALNPLHTIERQVSEVLIIHKGLTRQAARARTLELLRMVELQEVEQRLGEYPHRLSGGQRQRVMIAMALANEPDLLIADEPTTALDVTIEAQILNLLKNLQRRLGMATLFITHDLAVVRKMADKVCVMTEGRIVEAGPVSEVFARPKHPYTRHLFAAQPKGRPKRSPTDAPVVMACSDLKVHFPIKAGIFRRTVDHVRAVDGVSLTVHEGHTVGIVGESGSGKTTLGLALLRLQPSRGTIAFDGHSIQGLTFKDLRPLRRQMQVVFQDPFSSLSPRLPVGQIVGEGLKVHRIGEDERERRKLISQVLKEVGLDPETQDRYPHEFSGGQRQRIAIARAMVLKPRFVVLDEPTSALDMSVQAQIIDLLRELQERHKLAYLFISHDLKVIRALSHEVFVLHRGKVVESGPVEQIFEAPQSSYTKALMAAAFELEAVETGIVSV